MDQRTQRFLEQIQVVPLEVNHLDDLARLHYDMLPWSFNGQMGPAHIRDLYSNILNDENVFGSVCYMNNELMGFLTATMNSKATRQNIQKAYLSKLFKIAWALFKSPKTLCIILESKFLVPRIFKQANCEVEWLTFICNTKHSFISPFVAIKLMSQLNQDLSRRQVKYYMAQGIKDNPPAMKFYKALNWKIAKRLFMHNIYYFEVKDKP